MPGVPFQGQGRTFSRLVCLAGGTAQPTRILIEEYSGTPNVSGQYAWTRDLSAGEAETVLRGWLRGEIPALDGWTYMERSGLAAGNGASRPDHLPRSAPAPFGLALDPDRGWVRRQHR